MSLVDKKFSQRRTALQALRPPAFGVIVNVNCYRRQKTGTRGVCIAVSTFIFVVSLISVSVYCKTKCSAKSQVIAEHPVVKNGSSNPGQNLSKVSVDELI